MAIQSQNTKSDNISQPIYIDPQGDTEFLKEVIKYRKQDKILWFNFTEE